MKHIWIGVALLSLLLAAPAYGQFGDDDEGTTTTSDDTGSSSMNGSDDGDSGKNHVPDSFTIALVGGVAFPNDILNFNYFAAKFYLPMNGIQIEPFVLLSLATGYDETETGGTETRDEDSATSVGLGVLARYPMWAKHNVQFHIIGSGSITFLRTVDDDDGPDNSITTSVTLLGVGYGAGVEWYILKHVSVFAQATNPIATWTNSRVVTAVAGASDDEVRGSDFAIGIVWSPSVLAGFSLFF